MDQKAKVAVKCWLMLIKGFMGNLSNLLEGVATDAGDGHSLDDKEELETCVVIDSSAQDECVNGDNRRLEAKTNESELTFKVSICIGLQ
ncbi:hypothetical protein MTR_5g094190 [Medicago truncatula]|uniref:Uncharacterized protein n=1 Tax=Medicago truncatula TaxID=3880 RepID=G7K4B5_MEDTR|nr:hypothetical protein MTR_5g094190 [Medicago truncatula]